MPRNARKHEGVEKACAFVEPGSETEFDAIYLFKIQKLFPAKIITSENLQDEIGEQIDKNLKVSHWIDLMALYLKDRT